MNVYIVLFILLIITCFGYLLITSFHLLSHFSDIEILPYGFGLGVGICALQLIIYSVFAISWKLPFLCIPWGIFFLFVYIKKRKNVIIRFPRIKKINLLQVILLAFIFLLIFYVAFEAQFRPLSAWDGWAIWFMKAKIFFFDQGIYDFRTVYFENDYPHIFSLFLAYISSLIGVFDDKALLVTFFMFYLCLGSMFFFSLKKSFGITKALLFTFLLISTQNIIRHGGRWDAGYADLALGYYFFALVLLLKNYLNFPDKKHMIILQIFLAITSQIKNEGIPFSIIIESILLCVIARSKITHAIYIFIWLMPLFFWELYKRTHVFFPNYLFNKTFLDISRIFHILPVVSGEMFNIQRWNFLWIFFITGSVLFLLHIKKNFLTLVYFIFFLHFNLCIFFQP